MDMVAKSMIFNTEVEKYLFTEQNLEITDDLMREKLFLSKEYFQISDSPNLKMASANYHLDAGSSLPSYRHTKLLQPVPGVTGMVKITHHVDLPINLMAEFLSNLSEKINAYQAAASHLQ